MLLILRPGFFFGHNLVHDIGMPKVDMSCAISYIFGTSNSSLAEIKKLAKCFTVGVACTTQTQQMRAPHKRFVKVIYRAICLDNRQLNLHLIPIGILLAWFAVPTVWGREKSELKQVLRTMLFPFEISTVSSLKLELFVNNFVIYRKEYQIVFFYSG